MYVFLVRSDSSSLKQSNNNYSDEDERERYAGEFTSICLKNLNELIRVDDLREFIYNEFRYFQNFTVKISFNKKSASSSNSSSSSNSERIAFVNFSNHADAKKAKRDKMNKIFYGYPLYIEPVFKARSTPAASNSYSSRRGGNMSPPGQLTRDEYSSRNSSLRRQRTHSPSENRPRGRNNAFTSSPSPYNNERHRPRSRSVSPHASKTWAPSYAAQGPSRSPNRPYSRQHHHAPNETTIRIERRSLSNR